MTHELDDRIHDWNVTAFSEDEEYNLDNPVHERILDAHYNNDFRYTTIDRMCWDFLEESQVWGGDAISARDGFLSLSLLWFDFHADLLERGKYHDIAWLPELDEARAWVLHMRRIREVLLEQTRRQLSLYQLALLSHPDLLEEADPNILRFDVPYLKHLIEKCAVRSTLMDFWECLGVDFKVDAYSPGY